MFHSCLMHFHGTTRNSNIFLSFLSLLPSYSSTWQQTKTIIDPTWAKSLGGWNEKMLGQVEAISMLLVINTTIAKKNILQQFLLSFRNSTWLEAIQLQCKPNCTLLMLIHKSASFQRSENSRCQNNRFVSFEFIQIIDQAPTSHFVGQICARNNPNQT